MSPEEFAAVQARSKGDGLQTAQSDTSKYDQGFIMGGSNVAADLNEQRALRQTPGDKVKNGLVKMGGTAVTSFLEPFVDLTVGAVSAATEDGDAGARGRKLYDNSATQGLDNLNDYLAKEFPHYYSQKEQAMNPLQQLGTVNFWADKVGNGVGFMLGAVASGMVTGGVATAATDIAMTSLKAGRLAKGLATAAELASEVSSATKEGSAILGAVSETAGTALERTAGQGYLANKLGNVARAVSSTGGKQHLVNFTAGMVGAMGESGMEARQIAKDTGIAVRKQLMLDKGLDPNGYEDYQFSGAEEAHIKDLEEAAGNTGFAYNLALVGGTNALLLPKIFRKGYQAERVAADAIERSAETGLYEAAGLTGKQKIGKALKNVALNNLEEATQEQVQFALEKALPDYYRKQRDPQATMDQNEYLKSMVGGLAEAYGTKEGWENGLLGGIIGFAGAHTAVGEVNAQERTTQAAVATLNAAVGTKAHQALAKALVAQNAYAKAGQAATLDNNQRAAEDAAFGGFSSMVRGYSQAGKFEDLVEDLQKTGTLLPEEYKEQLGLAPDAELNGSPASIAAKQVQKAKALHKLSQEIEAAYPGDGMGDARDAFFGMAAEIQNSDSRERKMANELAAQTGISLDAMKLTNQENTYEKFTEAILNWSNAADRVPLHAREAAIKANDIQTLADKRRFLAAMYKRLEDPKHREEAFAAHAKYLATEAEIAAAKEKADAAAAKTQAQAPTVAPQQQPTDAPAGDADFFAAAAFDDGNKPAPAAPITPAAPIAAVPGKTYELAVSAAEGAPTDITVKVDSNGTVVGMVGPLGDLQPNKVAGWADVLKDVIAAKFAALGIAPAAVPAGVSAAQQAVLDKLAVLAQEGGPAYVDGKYVFPDGHPLHGKDYTRVSGLKKKLTGSPEPDIDSMYADRGNVADLIIRDYFIAANNGKQFTVANAKQVFEDFKKANDGREKKGQPDPLKLQLTDKFFTELLARVDTIKKALDEGGFKVFSETPTLYGTIDGELVIGTTDLVLVGPQGQTFIADIKTANRSRRQDYLKDDIGTDKVNQWGSPDNSTYREADVIQQAAYAELLKQRTGIEVKERLIFPIVATVKTGTATADGAALEPDGDGKYTIPLSTQKSVGKPAVTAIGKLDINGLIEHYTGKEATPPTPPAPTPAQIPPTSDKRVDAYTTATEDGKLLDKQVTAQPIGNMPLTLQIDGTTATVGLNPGAQEDLQRNGTSGLAMYFPDTPLPIPNKGAFTYEVATPATLNKTAGGWEVAAKGRLLLKYSDGSTSDDKATPVAEPVAEEEGLLEQLNTFISKTEDLAAAPEYQAWKTAVLAGQHQEPYTLVWDGDKQYNVTTTVDGKEVKLGYLNGATSTSTEPGFQARVAATVAFKQLIAGKYQKGDRIPLRLAVAVQDLDNVQTSPTVNSMTLGDVDGRYQYKGAWQVYRWSKPGKEDFVDAILGQYSAADEAEILARQATAGTDGYLVKVGKPNGGHAWVGLNTLPITGDDYGAIYDALLAGKLGTDALLQKQYFAATMARNGTHLKFRNDNIELLSNDLENRTLNILRPIKGAARPTDLSSFRAAFKAQDGEAADILNYVGHQVEKDMPQEQILKLLVPNTSKELWKSVKVFPEGLAGDGTPIPSVVSAEPAAVMVQPLELAQVPGAREEAVEADIERAGVRPNYRELDMDQWTDEEWDDDAERESATRDTPEQKPDWNIFLPTDSAALDAASRLSPTNWKRISKRLAAIAPEGLKLRSIQDLVTKVALSGREIGAFWRDTVYLADNIAKGTEEHEFFHALMETVFTKQEYSKAFAIGKSRTDLSRAAVEGFKEQFPEYSAYGASKLREQMVKETLANAYQDFINNKPGILASLWRKLKALLGFAQAHRDELQDLFEAIDRGGFKHRKMRLSNGAPDFKSIPNAAVAQSDKIVRLMTARLFARLNQLGEFGATKERRNEVLEQLVQERLKEDVVEPQGYSVERRTQEKLTRFTKEEAAALGLDTRKLYRKAYYAPESIAAIQEQVGHYWSFIGSAKAAEDEDTEEGQQALADADDSKDRNFDAGIMEVDGVANMDAAVRMHIAFTTVGEGASEQPVDFTPTVGLMMRNLENLRSLEAMRERLRLVASYPGNPQLAAVVKNLEAAFMAENGAYFGQQFFNAFYKQLLPSEDVLVSKKTGAVVLTSSDMDALDKKRLGQFFQNLEGVAAGERTANAEAVVKLVNNLKREVTPAGITALAEALPGMGLDLHPAFLQSVADGVNNEYLLAEKKGEQRSLLDDILGIAGVIKSGVNPYLRQDEEEDSTVATRKADSVSRSKALAKADSLWQPNLANQSYRNPEGKSQHPYMAPSYVTERGRDISEGKVDTTASEYAQNPLVKLANGDATFWQKLKLRNYGGVREKEEGDGKAFKSLDPKSYLVGAFALFQKQRLQFTQFEAKSSTLTLQIPDLGQGGRFTTADGKLTEQAQDFLRGFYEQDLALNEAVLAKLERIAAMPEGPAKVAALHGLEKTHDFKSYDSKNQPVLTTRAEVEAAYNMAPGAARDKAISALPRGLQLVQLPSLNKLTLEQRQDAALVASAIQAEVANEQAEFAKVLAGNELALDNAATQTLLMSGVTGYTGLGEYIGEFLVQDFILRNAYSQLQRGSEAHFKDAIDITKRAAGMLAAGPNAGKGTYKMAVLATDYSFLDADLNHVPATPELLALSNAELEKRGLQKNDDTDASGHMSDARFQDLLLRLGKSSPEIHATLQKLVDGEPDIKWDSTQGWTANALKNVVFGATSPYVKTATQPLFVQDVGLNMGPGFKPAKGQAAYTSPSGNVWVAKPQAAGLFKLYVQMKEQGIDEVYHDTAVKERLLGQNFRNADGHYGDEAGTLYAQEVPNSDWRLQMENPSGKQKIVHGTQLLQLLDANMEATTPVEYGGKTQTVAQWREEFQSALAAIRQQDSQRAFDLLQATVNGTSLFKQALRESLEASGTDQNTLDLFAQAANGDWQHSTDLPAIQQKYVQMFLAHFNKNVLSQKVPGLKVTLLPSSMRGVVVDATDEDVHDHSKPDHEQVYLDAYGQLKPEYKVRPLRMHTATKDEEGATTGIRKAEVILSEEFLVQHKLTKADLYSNKMSAEVREELLTMLGFRIPTQAHHSMLPFRVVGWVPAYMGSVAVAPAGITYLSGADYDVDSLYIMRKAFYADKQGVHLYGQQATSEGRWKEYLKVEEANNKGYVKAKQGLLLGNVEYQALKRKGAELKAKLKSMAAPEAVAQDIKDLTEAFITGNEDGTDLETLVSFKHQRLDKHVGIHLYREAEQSLKAIRDKMQELATQASEQVFTALGQPATLEQFQALPQEEQLTNYARQNTLLDASLALLMNGANWEAMRTPASTARLNDVIKDFEAVSGRGAKNSAPYNHFHTQFSHWLANSKGKDSIGLAALPNTAGAFVTKHAIPLTTPVPFFGIQLSTFGGLEESDVAYTKERGKLVVEDTAQPTGLKFDTSSAYVSAMADNAKEQAAARGNLSEETLPKAAAIAPLGAGLNRTMLFLYQPVLWELSEKVAALGNDWADRKSVGSVLTDLGAHIRDLLKDNIQEGFQATAQDAADALPFRIPAKGAKLSADDIRHLNTQLYTLEVYNQLNTVSADLGRVSAVLGLTKGVGITLADVDDKVLASKHVLGETTTINIQQALAGEKLLTGNLDILAQLHNLLPEHFLVRSPQVQELIGSVRQITARPDGTSRMKEEDLAKLELEYLSFLGVNSFQQYLTKQTGSSLAERQHLITSPTDNIVAKTKAVLADHPELRQNLLLRALAWQVPQGRSKFYGLTFNTRNKADATYTERLTDAFVELSAHEDPAVNAYARSLFLYLGVKSNFQFRNGSFLKVLPAGRMQVLSDGLNTANAAIRSGDASALRNATGYTLERGFTQFLRHYFSNPENRHFPRKLFSGDDANKDFTKYVKSTPTGNKVLNFSIVAADGPASTSVEVLTLNAKGFFKDENGSWIFPAFYSTGGGKSEVTQEPLPDQVYELLKQYRSGGRVTGAEYRVLALNPLASQQTPYHLTPEAAIGKAAQELPEEIERVAAPNQAKSTASASAAQAATTQDVGMTANKQHVLDNWEGYFPAQNMKAGYTYSEKLDYLQALDDEKIETTCFTIHA